MNFNGFLCATIFEKFQMWAKWMRLEGIFSLRFLIWNICKQSTVHLQLSPNLQALGEIFCKNFKRIYKLLEIDEQKD